MNGFEWNDRKIKVQLLTEQNKRLLQKAGDDLDDENQSHYLHSAQSRAMLMQKLSRDPEG